MLTCYLAAVSRNARPLEIVRGTAEKIQASLMNEGGRKISIFKTLGEGVKAGLGSVTQSVVGVNLTAGSAKSVNMTVAYKLLWHRCRSHRMRLGMESHEALMDMIVCGEEGERGGRGWGAREIIQPDPVLPSGFTFDAAGLYERSGGKRAHDTSIPLFTPLLTICPALQSLTTARASALSSA